MKKLFLITIQLFFIAQLYACSCHFQKMGVGKIMDSDLVFRGKIIAKTIEKNETENSFTYEQYKYTFKIKTLIKGVYQKKEIDIYSATQGSACGVNYSVGDEYYIYAYGYKETYSTGLCSNNMQKKRAKKAYKKITRQYKRANKKRTWTDVDNRLSALGKVANKIPEGEWIFYHEDGSIKSRGSYVNGKKRGQWDYFLNKEQSTKFIEKLNEKQLRSVENKENIMTSSSLYDEGARVETKQYFEIKEEQ